MPFSTFDRPDLLNRLRTETFDLLVIGGGITGAGIALDAASRGLKTALVEKGDFASGTSSRSTKLIHGGLRYLKKFELGLVREVGSERAIVHRLAPHLVVPEKMLLPLTDHSMSKLLASFGLRLYDWLADVGAQDKRQMLTRSEVIIREPLLDASAVKGGAVYSEYRTDDARLTLAIAGTAAQHGAVMINYCEVTDFTFNGDRVSGCGIRDVLHDESCTVSAGVVVNATGPWVDHLRRLNGSLEGKRLFLTKGVHIVVLHDKLPVRQAIYFDVGDGRMIFAIPRGRMTYIGTTDTPFDGDPDHVAVTRADAEYLVQAVNRTFPSSRIVVSDIESSWAGLRPLIYEAGISASELSRRDEIFLSPNGMISSAGGKLTGYRKMAERIVDRVIRMHFAERQLKECRTHDIPLMGNAFSGAAQLEEFERHISSTLARAGLTEHHARYLVHNYGIHCQEILDDFAARQVRDRELALLLSEMRFAVNHEMALTALDFFARRTARLYFDIQSVMKYGGMIVDEMGRMLGWDLQKRQHQLDLLDHAIATMREFQ